MSGGLVTPSAEPARAQLAAACALTVAVALAAWYGLEHVQGIVAKLSRLALYLAPLPLALALCRHLPAQPPAPGELACTLQDSCYFVLTISFRIVFAAVFIGWIAALYERHLGFLTLHPGDDWPVAWRILLGLLLSDFLAWFHHLVRHKVKPFWEFHKLHHSQTNLNFFTDFRLHPVDYVIANLIVLVPQLVLQVDAPTIVMLGIIVQWHTIFYHCNLRTNYGLLRFVFVTPQSHRVHHSIDPLHHGSNFGVIFSFWDQLFGTQHRDYRVYPDTGLGDEFPVERSLGEVLSLRSIWLQLVFPFRMLRKQAR